MGTPSGLRVMELLRLRVKDVDLARLQVIVRAGKADQDRVTMLPESLGEWLRAHRDRLPGRYPQRPRFARARGRGDHADLYARHEPARAGAQEPAGRAGSLKSAPDSPEVSGRCGGLSSPEPHRSTSVPRTEVLR